MKKTIGLLVQSVGALSLWGAITSVSDVAKMPTSGVEGRIEYTGATGTVATDLALNPAVNTAATFKVSKVDAELTFSGKLSAAQGAFIKSGPGTLKLAHPGAFTLGESDAATPKADLNWGASDGVASKGFTALTVADGTLEIGAPGCDVTVKGNTTVGARCAANSAPVLKVKGGAFKSGALYLDRGYSSASRKLVPEFEVSNCATAIFENVYMDDGGNTAHSSTSVLSVEGVGTLMKVTGYCSVGLHRKGTNTLNTLDGARFQHTANIWDHNLRVGLEIGGTENDRSGGVRIRRTVWNIDGGTGSVYAAYLNRGSEINVRNGGSLQLDRSMLYFNNNSNDWQRGALNFDGGSIGTWYSRVAEWFTGITNYTVGAKGMTVAPAADYSALDGHSSYADDAARTAKAEISVDADGTVALGAGEVPIRLKRGKLVMGVNGRHMGSSSTGRIHVDNGSSVVVSGENSLQNMVFEGGGTTTRFRHQGIEADRKRWITSGYAGFLADGSIRLGTCEWISAKGAAYLAEKMPVDRSFAVSWTYFGSASGSKGGVPYGVTAVFQNSGVLACGSDAAKCGYDGIGKSVAVSYDALTDNLKFGKNGEWLSDAGLSSASVAWATDPVRCSVSYDAESSKLVFSVYQPSSQRTDAITNIVNLAETAGEDKVHFGFLCHTCREYSGFHVIGDVRISTEKGRGYQKVGGHAEIAGGKVWKQELLADVENLGFAVSSLSYADGATLLTTPSSVAALPPSLYGSVNLGFDRISGTGTLVKDGSAGMALSAPGAAKDASVDLKGGSAILRKENIEVPVLKASDGGWCFTGSEIYWAGDDVLQFGPLANARGTSAQADPERVMNANTRSRYRVDGAWKVSFRAFATSEKGNDHPGFSFLLHNDPAGCEKRATGSRGGNQFSNAACFRFYAKGGFVYFGNAKTGSSTANGTTAISFADQIELNEKDSEVDIEIEHDPVACTMKITMTQGGGVFVHTWENVDLKSMIGDEERAYLSFGAEGDYDNPTTFKISGFAFAHVGAAPAEEDADVPYFGTLLATNSSVRIVLDSAAEGANYRLADNFKVADGCTLEVRSVKSPGVLDLGECDAPGLLKIHPRNGCVVKALKLKGATEVLVDGGTFAVSADGTLPSGAILRLYNGGKVRLENGGTLRVKKIFVDGEAVPFGVYAAGDADWIDGGNGTVTPGSALRIILR